MATVINFLVDQGTTFEGIATIQNEDGTIFDLLDYVPYAQMRRSYYSNSAVNIGVSVEGSPSEGNLKLLFLPADTDDLRPGRYVYDVEVHNPNDENDIKRVLQGVITLDPQATRPVPVV
jgi:hypothetical protein